MELCGRCRGEGVCIDERDGWDACPECGGGGYIDEYEDDEWYEDDDDDEESYWEDYQPDPLYEWRFPQFRPSFVAIVRWWGVQYLPVWCYGVARGFWFDSVVPHFRSEI